MKRVLLVAGEVSGDQLGAWYCNTKYGSNNSAVYLEAVGGDLLVQAGAVVFERFERLNSIGFTEIVSKIPFYYRLMQRLLARLQDGAFDELVLIDYPGFNLRFARMVRKKMPSVRIIYAAPPQLWCWGAWRITSLQKYCDSLVVLYPFEVAWYAARGVRAEYLGSPVVERVALHHRAIAERQHYIAIAPGSRATELKQLVPTCVAIMNQLAHDFSELHFVVPCAASYTPEAMRGLFKDAGLMVGSDRIIVVADPVETMSLLGQCSVAIAKPGTVTLELALLGIPTVMVFKTSWLNNVLARFLMTVPFRALPNLLLGKEIVPEFVQQRCIPAVVAERVAQLYVWFAAHDTRYNEAVANFDAVRNAMDGSRL